MSKHAQFTFHMKAILLMVELMALVSSAWSAGFNMIDPASHAGAPDGSAGIAVGKEHFIGVTDENNLLRLYSVADGSKGVPLLDLNPLLGIKAKVKDGKEKFDECDLEGAAKIGDRIYWIGSHGANKDGKPKKERQVLFATKAIGSDAETKLEMAGSVYRTLLDDLQANHDLGSYELGEAAKKPPKEEGALNIESLCTAGDALYIGFRNPVPEGKALVVPLANPEAVIAEGKPAMFGKPISLDLGGLGIRDMVWWRDSFLIIAGDYRDRFDSDAKPSKLFSWKGGDDQPVDLQVDFGDLNPEAVIVFPDEKSDRVLILSDDGARKIDGVAIKDMEESKQSFRSVWLQGGL
jgi:hypothetical protein